MRLEFDTVATEFPLNATSARDLSFDTTSWDYESILKKGIAAAQGGDRDGARKLLSQVTALNPASEDAWMWLASISDYPEELLAFLNRVLDINPDNDKASEWRVQTNALLARTFVQRALAARNDGTVDLARQYVMQALSHDAKCESAWFWKASLAESDDEKLEVFARLLELNPTHAEAIEAVENIKRENVRSALVQAQQHVDHGNMSEARDIASQLVSHEDISVRENALLVMADAAESEEDRIAAFLQILKINPANDAAKQAIEELKHERLAAALSGARTAAAAGRSDEALSILSDLLEQAPSSIEAWLLFSHLSTGLNEKVDALQRVLQIDPNNSAARSGLEYLQQTFGGPVETAPETPVVESETAAHYDVVDEPQDDFEYSENEDKYSGLGLSESAEFALRPTEDTVDVSELEMSPVEAFDAEEAVHYAGNVYETYTEEGMDGSGDPTTAPDTTDFTSTFTPRADEEYEPNGQGRACPFCSAGVEDQAISCDTCRAMLTLADLERLLSGVGLERDVVQQSVTAMEAEWNGREFSENELVTLGIGHMNLGNFDSAFRYLQEAARLNPNNVILSGHINTLAIRLEEMRRQNEIFESMPKGKTILVVDDSPTVRKLIAGKLEKSGHNVVCAVDGIDALEKLAAERPDLVLLDITMPRMDGYEVCKQIRANPAAKDLPVVMISGKDGFFDKVRGRMAGTSGYVTKPFGPETLMKALETYLLPDLVEVEQ